MKNIKFDFAAGLVVFFVALPLCIGISLASTSYAGVENLSDFAGLVFPGLIAGVVGGLVVGSFSGSKFGVSGPAAGLITIISAAIIEFGGFDNGGFEKFVLAVFLAGIIQVVLGFLKAGFIAYYIPTSVIKGMLAGIGITIVMKEIPHFFGYDKNPEGDLGFKQVDGHNTFSELFFTFENIHWGATIVGVISIVILLLWASKFIKENKMLNLVPGALLAIIVSIVVGLLMVAPDLKIAGEHLVQVPIADSFDSFKSNFHFPSFGVLLLPFELQDSFSAYWDHIDLFLSVLKVAIVIAIVASLESLLCVEATDKLDPHKGRTPLNQELKAQGIGNIISGLLGGLPITQVIVRSTANISAGAKSKNSAIIHGGFLLLFIVAFPALLNMIPRATLAAVLLVIGYKLAKPVLFKQMFNAGWSQFVPFVATIVGMLLTDLLTGVGIGIAVAVLWILYSNFRVAYFVEDFGHAEGEPIRLSLSQHATFLNKASIIDTFDRVPDGEHVVLDLSKSTDIDYDVMEAINEFKTSAVDRNITLEIIGQQKVRANQKLG